jgi:hypothetical protein
MAEQVINPTRLPKDVVIKYPDGKTDVVFVQPSSRVTLPRGASVDSRYLERERSLVVKKSIS